MMRIILFAGIPSFPQLYSVLRPSGLGVTDILALCNAMTSALNVSPRWFLHQRTLPLFDQLASFQSMLAVINACTLILVWCRHRQLSMGHVQCCYEVKTSEPHLERLDWFWIIINIYVNKVDWAGFRGRGLKINVTTRFCLTELLQHVETSTSTLGHH